MFIVFPVAFTLITQSVWRDGRATQGTHGMRESLPGAYHEVETPRFQGAGHGGQLCLSNYLAKILLVGRNIDH
jgi:hypothetical protein